MSVIKVISVREEDLPLIITITGSGHHAGMEKHYRLLRGNKKFGVCLNVEQSAETQPGRSGR